MITIITMMRFGRVFMALALTIAFAMHSPIACSAARESCHHSSRSDAPLPCCNTVMCVSVDARHDAATPAPSLANGLAPALIAYLAPRPPLAGTPLVIELRTLLI
jgi:hypothetical protein